MTREEFTAEAIKNGWKHTISAGSVDIFDFNQDRIRVTILWGISYMSSVKREREGQITDFDNIDAEESATRWIRAPRQIRNANQAPKVSRGR